jgi:hypothetical protein
LFWVNSVFCPIQGSIHATEGFFFLNEIFVVVLFYDFFIAKNQEPHIIYFFGAEDKKKSEMF